MGRDGCQRVGCRGKRSVGVKEREGETSDNVVVVVEGKEPQSRRHHKECALMFLAPAGPWYLSSSWIGNGVDQNAHLPRPKRRQWPDNTHMDSHVPTTRARLCSCSLQKPSKVVSTKTKTINKSFHKLCVNWKHKGSMR